MSGIAGYMGLAALSAAQGRDLLQRMGRFQAHRGPDGEGCFQEAAVGIGHRRLQLFDTPDGDQPKLSADGRYVLSMNGSIYNAAELRAELQAQGVEFQGESDAELVLAAFANWGNAAFERFNGMWGLAIYDRLTVRLTLCRDHLGVKPLYFAPVGGELVDGQIRYTDPAAAAAGTESGGLPPLLFASELKPIVFSGLLPRQPNERSIYRYLRFRLHDDNAETFFAGVYQLLGGQLLEADAQGVRISSYTTLIDELIASAHADQHVPYTPQSAQRYYQMLRESVRLRLRSDRPVGTALSGGMDSTTLATLVVQLMEQDPAATRAVGARQQTFSAVFPNSINDEEQYIDAFIRRHPDQIDPHKTAPQVADFIRDLDDFINTMEMPIISTGPYAQYQMFRMAGQHVSVFLTGAGPDEMMAGYVPYYAVYLRQLRRQHRYLKLLHEGLFATDKIFRLLRVRFASRLGGKKAWSDASFINPEFAERFRSEHYRPVQDNLKLRLVGDLTVSSAPCVARYEDRSAMRFSLEGRLPFVDTNLVRYIWAQSDDALIHHSWNKRMLRDAMLPYLPPEVANRRNKIGFSTPEVEWFSALQPQFQAIFDSDSFAQRPYFNQETVRTAWQAYCQGHGDATTLVFWRLLNLELWLRHFIDAPLPETPPEPVHPRGGQLRETSPQVPPLAGSPRSADNRGAVAPPAQ